MSPPRRAPSREAAVKSEAHVDHEVQQVGAEGAAAHGIEDDEAEVKLGQERDHRGEPVDVAGVLQHR